MSGKLLMESGRGQLLLASVSVAALMLGGGASSAFAACYTGPFPYTNAGAASCISVSNTSFTGNVANTGTVSPGGITVTNSTITGSINDTGTIAGGVTNSGTINAGSYGIDVEDLTFAGGISNRGTITAQNAAIYAYAGYGGATFAGGITNSGTLTTTIGDGTAIAGYSAFSGGISNIGTITAAGNGISFDGLFSFAGGINNSGTITAHGTGISASDASTFTGGITNSGVISAGSVGIQVDAVRTYLGGITNSGTITAGIFGIDVDTPTFAGGLTNSGLVSGEVGIISFPGTAGFSIFNSGTITGTIGTAIEFVGGTSTLTLGPGSVINGNVIGYNNSFGIAGSDIFQLGGAGTGSFNLSSLGTQYTGFTTFNVVGATWVATGTGSQNWNIESGTLQLGNGGTSGAITGNVTDNGTFAIDRSDTYTFGGTISGNGSFVQMGPGTTVLSGSNSHTGGTTISAGTLQVTNNNSVGTGTVALDGGTFQAGANGLSFGNGFAINVAGGMIDTQANTLTLSGTVGNGNGTTGALNKIGTGTLVLSGINTFSGGTAISAGNLQVTNNSSVGTGTVTLNGGTFQSGATGLTVRNTFAINTTGGTIDTQANTLTLSGLIANGNGPGALTKVGSGTLIIIGGGIYSGGTTISAGTVQIGNGTLFAGPPIGPGSIIGNVADNGILAFDNPFYTFGGKFGGGGVISGSGVVQVLQPLLLAGTNTYTGPTTVNNRLELDGSIASSSLTTVNGFLTGAGTAGNLQINSGGTFAPGANTFFETFLGSAGTSMKVAGNLAFQSGTTYLIDVNPTTASSANVSGTASLAGTVNAFFERGNYLTKQYTILESAGLNGTTFSGLTTSGLPNGGSASLAYNVDDVLLDLTVSLPTTGLNVNQQNVAGAITNFFNSGGALPPGFTNLFNLAGSNLANALTLLDGEDATGAEHGAFELTNEFLGLMLDPFVYGRGGPASGGGALGFAPDQNTSFPPDVALAYAGLVKAPPKQAFDHPWTVWGASDGGSGTFDGHAAVGSTNVTASTYGFAAGADYHATPDTVLGFALAGAGTNWGLEQGLGTGRSDAFQAGVYGTKYFGSAYLGAAFAFTNNWFTTNRAALGDELTARFQGQSYGMRAEGGYHYAVAPAMGVTPYAAIQAQDFHTPTYSETDLTGGGFGLTYNAMSAADTRSELGARFDALTAWGATPVQVRARLAWAHDWVSNPALDAAFQALPGTSFVVIGAAVPANSALTSVGAELHLTPRWTVIGKFDGEFASSAQTYAGSGTLRYAW